MSHARRAPNYGVMASSRLARLMGYVASVLVTVMMMAGAALAQGTDGEMGRSVTAEFVPGELLVKFQPSLGRQGALEALTRQGLRLAGQVKALGVLKIAVEPGREIETAASLRDRSDVLYAEPNYLVHALDTVPDDPYYSWQWGLPRIEAPGGWDWLNTTGGANLVIAIVDTGIDLSHPDFACDDKLMAGWDFVNDDADPQDDDWRGHGTHVAGIAGACSNNAIGVAGVAWAVQLMPVKVLDSVGQGSYADLADGITYAVDHEADIVNLSLGGVADSQIMSEAVQYAVDNGRMVVAAAGNCAAGGSGCGGGVNPIMYPAAYSDVLAVAATDSDDGHPYFSEHHSYVDLSAPGVDIYSSTVGSYGWLSGTSMSAPLVSGLAALVWSMDGELSADQAEELMEANADDVGATGKDDYFGYGRINAWRTLQSLATLGLVPTQVALIADDQTGPLPKRSLVTLSTTSAHPITWTASITPTVSWLGILPPASGSVSAAAAQSVTLVATRPVTYGLYYATLIISGTTGSGPISAPATAEVSLHYLPQLYRQVLCPIVKDAPLP